MRGRIGLLLSLGIFLIASAMWLRSGSVYDCISWTTKHRSLVGLHSGYGRLGFSVSTLYHNDRPLQWTRGPSIIGIAFPFWPSHRVSDETILGIGFYRGPGWAGWPHWATPGTRVWMFTVQWNRLAALAAIAPVVWVFRRDFDLRRRQKRLSAGLCGECGYDLRETKDKCPECGTPVAGGAKEPELIASDSA